MPLGKKHQDGRLELEEERRQRAKLRTSYGNKLSNLNLERLRHTATTSLRRIASSFAHVSDVSCGSCAALPHEDNEDDACEERAEILIRSEPFQIGLEPTATATSSTATGTGTTLAQLSSSSSSERRNHYLCADVMQTRASERWAQIACTVSALFRVRRISTADPFSELRRLREQRDLLEAFTRPFLYEDAVQPK